MRGVSTKRIYENVMGLMWPATRQCWTSSSVREKQKTKKEYLLAFHYHCHSFSYNFVDSLPLEKSSVYQKEEER